MFIGHFGVALGAERLAPRASLGTLFLSVQLPDLLWPVFLLLGLERVRIAPGITALTPLDFYDYPVTHSLAGVLGWAGALGLAYYGLRRRASSAGVLAAGVISHWVLDFVTHRPDMPLLPHGPYVGLGLWNSLPATIAVEATLFALGLVFYLRESRPADRVGRYAFAALIGFLLIAQAAAYFAPPPPSERALAWGSLSVWLLVFWATWADRHRAARESVNRSEAWPLST